VVRRPAPRHVSGGEVELAHQRLDLAGVLALEQWGELPNRLCQSGPAERLAPAAHAVFALYADDRPVVVGFDDRRGDGLDVHQAACSSTIFATTPRRSSIRANASRN